MNERDMRTGSSIRLGHLEACQSMEGNPISISESLIITYLGSLLPQNAHARLMCRDRFSLPAASTRTLGEEVCHVSVSSGVGPFLPFAPFH
jgi:hypothetical protein